MWRLVPTTWRFTCLILSSTHADDQWPSVGRSVAVDSRQIDSRIAPGGLNRVRGLRIRLGKQLPLPANSKSQAAPTIVCACLCTSVKYKRLSSPSLRTSVFSLCSYWAECSVRQHSGAMGMESRQQDAPLWGPSVCGHCTWDSSNNNAVL